MSNWLSLQQNTRYTVMHHFRHAMTRACFAPYTHKLRNVRRLWRWAKASTKQRYS